MRPMLAAIGSTMTHAVFSSSSGTTLYGTTRVSRTAPSVTPAEPGKPERGDAAPRLREQEVAVTVVVAGELHDRVAAGEAAGHANGGHRRLGAARHEANELAARNPVDDRLGQQHLSLRRRAVARASRGGLLHGGHDGGMGVAGDDRAVRLHQVDVATTLDVPHVRTFRPSDEVRRAADGAERAHRRVDASGDHALGAREQLLVRVVGHPASVSASDRAKYVRITRRRPPA